MQALLDQLYLLDWVLLALLALVLTGLGGLWGVFAWAVLREVKTTRALIFALRAAAGQRRPSP